MTYNVFQTVRLPEWYDDTKHRPTLIRRIHSMNPKLQVSHIIQGVAFVTTDALDPEPADRTYDLELTVRAGHGKMVSEIIRRDGLAMTRFEPEAGVAVGSPIAGSVIKLRDAIAQFVGAHSTPWDVSVTTRWETPDVGEPYICEVHIHRVGVPILNRSERMAKFREVIYAVVPFIEGTTWMVDDRYSTGEGVVLTRLPDPLLKGFDLEEFEARFRTEHAAMAPEKSWQSFPVAVREDGEPVVYTLFHTLVVGQTGAGKGSVLWGIMSGLMPAMREGLVEIYAIDPKNAEAKDPVTNQPSGIFKQVATTPEQWDPMLEELVAKLKARQATSGRSFSPTKENPLVILLVDELSALAVLDIDAKRAKRVEQNQLVILSQGRSDGFLQIAAVQSPQKQMIGNTRQFYAMRVALRTETPIETDLALGDGAVEAGAASHLIPPANPGNGYATAGIGYMRIEGEVDPVRVRFPYTGDEQLHAWATEFAGLHAQGKPTASTVDVDWGEVISGEQPLDDDGLSGITIIE